jgi:hypothetical protein
VNIPRGVVVTRAAVTLTVDEVRDGPGGPSDARVVIAIFAEAADDAAPITAALAEGGTAVLDRHWLPFTVIP